MKNIQTFLEKYYKADDKIILACSAGPDSMFLLYQILDSQYAKNLVVCYFNHKTRPETENEEKFLENLAKQRWFEIEVADCDFKKLQKLYPGKSFEELARDKRYQFFDAVMNIHQAKYVITGHHLDDKIETFMFNMLRGSKLSGLTNMKESHGWVLRPLLSMEKTEILEYLDDHRLEYKIDQSNAESIYTRNKIRNDILPKSGEINRAYRKNMWNLMNYLEEVQEWIDEQVEKFIKTHPPTGTSLEKGRINKERSFLITDFNDLTAFLQKEVIRYVYYISNGKSTIWLSSSNIDEVIRFINGKNNKTVKEIKNLKMSKDNKKILW